jgi:small subunit ribosomal protein S21
LLLSSALGPGVGVAGKKEADHHLTQVKAGDNESFESLLKRFNKRVQQDGILAEIRHREFFEKRSVKRKRKEAAKRRKSARAASKSVATR